MSEEAHHGVSHYVKIYFVLLGLLVVSILGPEIGIKWVTLVTAFGIAIVKALMVAAYFMHLNIEKKYIWYMLYTMLAFVFLFFIGIAADVMQTEGTNWINESSLRTIEESTAAGTASESDHN